MYNHEIQELLRIKNNLVTIKEYIEICNSPQVDNILYENETFNIWTSDGHHFALKIKCDII